MRPESFDSELQDEWSQWVLEHGLPDVPSRNVAVGQAVPVAYWKGPITAAVAHISREWHEDNEEAETQLLLDLFYRLDSHWVSAGDWSHGLTDASSLADIHISSHHEVAWGPGCLAIYGHVEPEAAVAEVSQAGQVTRRPVDSPIGLLVLCGESGDGAPPFAARVLNAHGEVLADIDAEAVWQGWRDPEARPSQRPGRSWLPALNRPRPGHGKVWLSTVDDNNHWEASWQDGRRWLNSPMGTRAEAIAWALEAPALERVIFSAEQDAWLPLEPDAERQ